MRPTLVYKGCGESSEGLHPSRIHGMRSTPVYKGRGQSLEGVDPSRLCT